MAAAIRAILDGKHDALLVDAAPGRGQGDSAILLRLEKAQVTHEEGHTHQRIAGLQEGPDDGGA